MEVADRRNRETYRFRVQYTQAAILSLSFPPSLPLTPSPTPFRCARTLFYKKSGRRPIKKTARQLREHPACVPDRDGDSVYRVRKQTRGRKLPRVGGWRCLIAPEIPSNDPKSGGSARSLLTKSMISAVPPHLRFPRAKQFIRAPDCELRRSTPPRGAVCFGARGTNGSISRFAATLVRRYS